MAMRQACGFHQRQAGVTLIEQIMVVALLGVLAAIAAPPLTQLLRRNQVRLAQTEFIAALQHARGTAAFSGKRTLLCPSRDGVRCSGETRWESGWLVGHDPARKGQPAGAPLRVGAAYAGITILGDSGRRLVRFQNDGSAAGMTNTLRFCHRGQPNEALVVVISNSGRVRGAKATPQQAASCAAAQ
ncbi:GspH/FimT family pseudopilin [Rhodanobacter sp. PCA2]|uniref:GspH/FimT family pseudopilin n=1 Tax=Rhodanobacter sp. PCA2 TaxID=2006117 RepID=UPI0021045F15|nr:GspH/FimT family pseudopilin [Rhodanobacter sp. PCA2]